MAHPDTALERRPESAGPERPVAALGHRLAGALQRSGAAGAPRRRPLRVAAPRSAAPVGERLFDVLERGLTRAVERRLGGRPSTRTPGALEQRLVAVLERRFSVGRRPVEPAERLAAGTLDRLGRSVARRRRGGGLPAAREQTLRALVVGIVARGVVKTLVLFMRILGRGLLGAPMRGLARMLAKQAIAARGSRQAGLLGVLVGAAAVLVRAVRGRPAAASGAASRARRAAVLLVVRLLRRLLAPACRLAARQLRRLVGLLGRALGRTSRRRG